MRKKIEYGNGKKVKLLNIEQIKHDNREAVKFLVIWKDSGPCNYIKIVEISVMKKRNMMMKKSKLVNKE